MPTETVTEAERQATHAELQHHLSELFSPREPGERTRDMLNRRLVAVESAKRCVEALRLKTKSIWQILETEAAELRAELRMIHQDDIANE